MVCVLLATGTCWRTARAQVFAEDFEGGGIGWTVDNGVWEVGVPTSGPGAAHQGTNVVATILAGNYPEQTDSRLISPTINLPAVVGSAQLELRFWHWFNYNGTGGADFGQVQISVWNGTSWGPWVVAATPVAAYAPSSANPLYLSDWSKCAVPLTAYAGQTVRLAFYHEAFAGSTGNSSSGWYLDEITIWQGVPQMPVVETFENGWGDWYAENGVWQIGVPTSGPGAAHQGTNVAATILAGNYPEQTDSRLISPALNLPTVTGTEQLELRFWQWFNYSGTGSTDLGYVQISVWDGNTWGSWVTLANPVAAHTPSSANPLYISDWSKCAVTVTAYAGQKVRFAFYHQASAGSTGNSSTGWYLDEITVWQGVPQMPVVETFENGWGDWYAENGVWQIGVPTSGPGAAHQGTNVAATILAGNYPEQTDSRLISPVLNLPTVTGTEQLELRFWQWFNYSGTGSFDLGYVQISVWDGSAWGSWVTLANPIAAHTPSSAYPVYSSDWSKCAVRVTAYAGQKVRLAFYHQASAGSTGNSSTGWYLDEITIWRGVPQMPVVETFENGWGDWYAENGVWQIGGPSAGGAIGGTQVAGAVLAGNYPEQTDSRLISPAFLVPAAVLNPEVRFWERYVYAALDAGYFQVSEWTGADWTPWVTLATPAPALTSSDWKLIHIPLAGYGGRTVRLAFYHTAARSNSGSGQLTGWQVDNVEIFPNYSVLLGSAIMRTGVVSCVAIRVEAVQPVTNFSFAVKIPTGHVASLAPSFAGRFINELVTPGAATNGSSLWVVELTTSATNPVVGSENIGSFCVTPASLHSAFVPVEIANVMVPLYPGWTTTGVGNRWVVIANEPLLEAALDGSGQRMAILYGKPDTSYRIGQSANLAVAASAWSPAWTNLVPASLSITTPVQGALSNSPNLFLNAQEE